MKIILDKCQSKNITAAKLWIQDGSRADPINKKGINQILSSIMCRGCGPYDNNQLAELIENAGAILNCDTYEDGLLISLKCISSDIYKLLPLIGWMITKPALEDNQIELEKDLTIKALKRQKENSYQQAFDGWRKMIYGNSPYGHDPLGSINDINRIKKIDIIPIAKSLINRKKTLVISGSIPQGIDNYIKDSISFKDICNNILETDNQGQNFNYHNIIHKQDTNISTRYLDSHQVVILLGTKTISHNNQGDLLLRLISCYLGYGMTSVLFKLLREKHGVVYEAGVYHPVREYETPFILHASTTEEKAILTIKLLNECWENIIHNQIPPEELILLKTKFRGQIAHSLQSINQRAERLAHLLGIGLQKDHDKTIEMRLSEITSKEIKDAAILYLKKPSLSVCSSKEIAQRINQDWNN